MCKQTKTHQEYKPQWTLRDVRQLFAGAALQVLSVHRLLTVYSSLVHCVLASLGITMHFSAGDG